MVIDHIIFIWLPHVHVLFCIIPDWSLPQLCQLNDSVKQLAMCHAIQSNVLEGHPVALPVF